MGAPVGNEFWRQRTKHGKDKLFSNPAVLWEAATTYFSWCDANPRHRNEAIKSGDMAGNIVRIPVGRPYSLAGLCVYLRVNSHYFMEFEIAERSKAERDPGNDNANSWLEVIKNIKDVIYVEKYEGAVTGNYNPLIIARDLRLTDGIQVTGDPNNPVTVTNNTVIYLPQKGSMEQARQIGPPAIEIIEEYIDPEG